MKDSKSFDERSIRSQPAILYEIVFGKKIQLLQEPQPIHHTILVNETISKFGYDPRYLKSNSEKLVVKLFECCSKIEDRKFRGACKQHLCLTCSNKINSRKNLNMRSSSMKEHWSKNNHPRLGKHHTEEVRKKISDSRSGVQMSDETREKISKATSGKNNPMYGKRHTVESIDKIKNNRRAPKGKDSNFYGRIYHGKGSWVESSIGRIWVRSSYELATVKYLDLHKINWLFEPKKFEITYMYNGSLLEGTYTPDFYIEDLGIYVETKGYWRDDAKAKYKAFIEQYPELVIDIWDYKKLKEIGIL